VKGATQKLKGLVWRWCSPRCNDSGGDSVDSDVPGGGLWWRSGQMAPAQGDSGGILWEEMVA
jgi:hypothetical protein